MKAWRIALNLLFLVVACASEQSVQAPAPAPKAAVNKVPSAPAGQPTDANTTSPFIYTPVGKRDPFRSYLLEFAEQNAQAQGARRREETETYELDQYRLTAVMSGTSRPRAMVEDPAGRGHVVHLGTRLGKNGGRITRISSSEVVICEETRDPSGNKVTVALVKRLPKPDIDAELQR